MPDTVATDLMFRPATELAELVRSGEVSARELVQASLDRIDAVNGDINAFVDVYADDALAEADAIGPGDERPFAGVPIAVKNNRAIAGKRLTYAAEFFGDYIPQQDHNVTRRLRDAGFVIVGSTTLPEFGILPCTETKRFGPTNNPWDTTRTPGGSSGGSGAAVAAGMLPIAHGNDGGGSTRIPAACNGLVGLKPQRGRISMAPEIGHNFLTQDGVLTRTVAETALLLDILAGYELGDATWAPPPAEPFAATAAREPGRLRIGFTTVAPVAGVEVDPVCAQACTDAAALLESLGHEVEEATPPWPLEGVEDLFAAVFGPAISLQIMFASLLAGREPAEEEMETLSWAIWQVSKSLNAVQGLGAEAQISNFGRMLTTWVAGYDAILTPALAEAPVTTGTLDPMAPDPMSGTFARSAHFTPFTAPFNISGSPAISLPFAHREDLDLPVGLQIVGQPAQEGALLALSAQIEQARPWADRRPAIAS